MNLMIYIQLSHWTSSPAPTLRVMSQFSTFYSFNRQHITYHILNNYVKDKMSHQPATFEKS